MPDTPFTGWRSGAHFGSQSECKSSLLTRDRRSCQIGQPNSAHPYDNHPDADRGQCLSGIDFLQSSQEPTQTVRPSGNFNLAWTDDSGQDEGGYLWRQGAGAGQFSDVTGNTDGGIVRTMEVKAGMPLTYAMNQQGPPDNSAYSLYYVVERLE
jgi:hypothetical protein